jgi:hypothetical protein
LFVVVPELPAQSAANLGRFKLVCNHYRRVADYQPSKEASIWTFRIDLKSARWCSSSCDTVQALVRATEGELVLIESSYENADVRMDILFKINRRSGDGNWDWYINGRPYDMAIVTDCKRVPFSGFPTRKF